LTICNRLALVSAVCFVPQDHQAAIFLQDANERNSGVTSSSFSGAPWSTSLPYFKLFLQPRRFFNRDPFLVSVECVAPISVCIFGCFLRKFSELVSF